MGWRTTIEDIWRGRDFEQASLAERREAARDVVSMAALSSSAVALVPVPLSEFVLATPVHIAMVTGVGHVYGRRLNQAEARELFTELAAVAGTSIAARQVWLSLSKIIAPGIGSYLVAPYVYATSWALGRMAMAYFERPEDGTASLRDRFQEYFAEGKKGFSFSRFWSFLRRSRNDDADLAADDSSAEPAEDSEAEPAVEAVWEPLADDAATKQQPAGRSSPRQKTQASATKSKPRGATTRAAASNQKKSTRKTSKRSSASTATTSKKAAKRAAGKKRPAGKAGSTSNKTSAKPGARRKPGGRGGTSKSGA